MLARTKIGILLIVYAIQVAVSAPSISYDYSLDHGFRIRRAPAGEKETGRVFWSGLGDLLEALPFLPFTVNVPDTLSSMWNFVTGFFPGSTSSRPSGNKKPKRNSTSLRVTGEDVMDYLLF